MFKSIIGMKYHSVFFRSFSLYWKGVPSCTQDVNDNVRLAVVPNQKHVLFPLLHSALRSETWRRQRWPEQPSTANPACLPEVFGYYCQCVGRSGQPATGQTPDSPKRGSAECFPKIGLACKAGTYNVRTALPILYFKGHLSLSLRAPYVKSEYKCH